MQTTQITKLSRNSILNPINILTILFAILMQLIIIFAFPRTQLLSIFIYVIITFYTVKLGLTISKPIIQTKIIKNEQGKQIAKQFIRKQQYTKIKIGQSIISVCKLFIQNIVICVIIIVFQVSIAMLLQHIIQKITVDCMDLAISIIEKVQLQMADSGKSFTYITDQQQLEMMAKNLMKFIAKINPKIYLKLYSYILTILGLELLLSVFYYLMNCYKFVLFGQIQNRKQKQINNINNNDKNILIVSLKQFYKFNLSWMGIKSNISLTLRLWWTLFFGNLFNPYVHVCKAFMYRNMYNLQQLKKSIQVAGRQLNDLFNPNNKQKQQNNNLETKNQVIIIQQKRVNILNQNDIQKQVRIQNQNNAEQENKQQQITNKQQKQKSKVNKKTEKQNEVKLSESQMQVKQKITERLGQQMAQLYQRLKKTNSPCLQIRKRNTNFARLVYRPYENDVIKVKKFSKIE